MAELANHDVLWIVRRLPQRIETLLKDNRDLFLAGGFIRACIAQEAVNDIDLFTVSKERAEQLAEAIAKEAGVPLFRTENAISLKLGGLVVQFIHRWTFTSPVECVQSFDFTIARAAVWWDQIWVSTCDAAFYQDLAAKRLVYCHPVRNEDAGGSLLRLLKFYGRGYRAPLASTAGVVARLCDALDEGRLNLQPHESREQAMTRVLTGLLKEVDPNSIDVMRV